MAIEKVAGIAVLSGKGGVGKSVISLNLSLALGTLGVKTLLFDAGGGDLPNLTNAGYTANVQDGLSSIKLTDKVSLSSPETTDFCSILSEDDIDRFLTEIVRSASGYKCIVFDCPTGSGPVSYILAGLSEISIIVSTPDPTSIAGAYLLVKSMYNDGLSERCGILFNRVDSIDEAASLQTRFDILTNQFLQHKFSHTGHIHDDTLMAESVLEQQPLLLHSPECQSGVDIFDLAEKFCSDRRGLQIETEIFKNRFN